MERLQKYLSACGVASRRKSEEIILSGKVKVNGVVIKELGYKVNDNDIVVNNLSELENVLMQISNNFENIENSINNIKNINKGLSLKLSK